ncbi:hypothetical protein [Hyalangium gracile]|uniref:hypothetical protein n=1 Tax=Hyalangium gracile TaxID=394092 RepID=UPI001CC9C5E3|nr:hypothetical protein [Hyalangium gracile]
MSSSESRLLDRLQMPMGFQAGQPFARAVSGHGAGADPVARMSATEKLRKVVWYALSSPELPNEVKRALAELFSPQNLAIAAAVLGVWGASHFFGVGEVVDVILVGTAYATLGVQAVQGLVELSEFGLAVVNAKSDADLRRAASSLTRAIALLGAEAALALLTRKARIELRGRKNAPSSRGQAPTSTSTQPPRSSSGAAPRPVSSTALRDRVMPVHRAKVQQTQQELQRIVQQAVQRVDSGQGQGKWARNLSRLPTTDPKYPMWRGNAIDQEVRTLIEQAKRGPNPTLPANLKTNVGGPFAPGRPDIQLPLGNGHYAIWDVTSQRQLGHAVKYVDKANKTPAISLDYLAEITY